MTPWPTALSLLVVLSLSSLGFSGSADGNGNGQIPLGRPGQSGLGDLVTKANTYLSTGKFNDAVKAYSEAIDLSPIDYLLYYKRATSLYSLQKHQQALQDFDKVLELTEYGFERALLMKARVYTKEGMWDDARESTRSYLQRVKSIPITSTGSGSGSGSKESHSGAIEDAQNLLSQIQAGEQLTAQAKKAYKAQLNAACVDASTEAIKIASHDAELRMLRAECEIAGGDAWMGVVDLVRATHLSPNPSTSLFLRIAYISYFLTPPSPSSSAQAQHQQTLKQCLHLDPDSKLCASLHRQLKKIDKEIDKMNKLRESKDWVGLVKLITGGGANANANANGDGLANQFDDLLERALDSMSLPPPPKSELPHPKKWSPLRRDIYLSACIGYTNMNLPGKGERWCDEVLGFVDVGVRSEEGGGGGNGGKRRDEDVVDALVGKSEALLGREEFEDAVRFLERAWEGCGRSRQDVAQKLQKAQKVLKLSKRKDYYKILGVSRDADGRTVKRAYHRAAKLSHPDKGGSETLMASVNEAYEVLSNPELRARFDNGEDPMDPSAQNGGSPFQQGAGGGPFAAFFQQAASGAGAGGGGGIPFGFQQGHGGAGGGGGGGGFRFQWTQGH